MDWFTLVQQFAACSRSCREGWHGRRWNRRSWAVNELLLDACSTADNRPWEKSLCGEKIRKWKGKEHRLRKENEGKIDESLLRVWTAGQLLLWEMICLISGNIGLQKMPCSWGFILCQLILRQHLYTSQDKTVLLGRILSFDVEKKMFCFLQSS